MGKYEGVMIFAERDGVHLHKVGYELLGKGRALADGLGTRLIALSFCSDQTDSEADAQALGQRGADEVFQICLPAREIANELLMKANLEAFIRAHKPEIVLIGATHLGRSMAPRVAAALNTGLTADCTDLKVNEDGRLIQIRPAFSNNIFAHIRTDARPQMATIRYKEFSEASVDTGRIYKVTHLEPYTVKSEGLESEWIQEGEKLDISEAEVVVSGGRGFRKAEDLKLLHELAELLGGEVGASRTIVDAGMIGSAHQVGYSGNRVKPKLYIACGISGAPQHLAGMKEADRVIAINKDASAPIFNAADVGYVGDLYEILPAMIQAIREEKSKNENKGGVL